MKKLKKGDEVVITYLDESKGALTKSARHDALWRKFLFHCSLMCLVFSLTNLSYSHFVSLCRTSHLFFEAS